MADFFIYIIVLSVLVVFFIIRFSGEKKSLKSLIQKQNELLQNYLVDSNRSIEKQFEISQNAIFETQKQTSEIIRNVSEKLTIVESTNSQIVDFAKQLESLESILKNPKQRGILGEYYLETTLKNVLSVGNYQMQYKFKNGDIVDAVVFVKDKIITIDSKFPLDNYNKFISTNQVSLKKSFENQFISDLKKRIDEASKYINPEENTMDFVFMFIPSELIYYDILSNKIGSTNLTSRDLLTYAFVEKKVIIVSPTSFLAYLQTVLQGLKALQIEESAHLIRKNVIRLGKHLKIYEEYFEKLGNNLKTTVNFYEKAEGEFLKIEKDINNIELIDLKSEEQLITKKIKL